MVCLRYRERGICTWTQCSSCFTVCLLVRNDDTIRLMTLIAVQLALDGAACFGRGVRAKSRLPVRQRGPCSAKVAGLGLGGGKGLQAGGIFFVHGLTNLVSQPH